MITPSYAWSLTTAISATVRCTSSSRLRKTLNVCWIPFIRPKRALKMQPSGNPTHKSLVSCTSARHRRSLEQGRLHQDHKEFSGPVFEAGLSEAAARGELLRLMDDNPGHGAAQCLRAWARAGRDVAAAATLLETDAFSAADALALFFKHRNALADAVDPQGELVAKRDL